MIFVGKRIWLWTQRNASKQLWMRKTTKTSFFYLKSDWFLCLDTFCSNIHVYIASGKCLLGLLALANQINLKLAALWFSFLSHLVLCSSANTTHGHIMVYLFKPVVQDMCSMCGLVSSLLRELSKLLVLCWRFILYPAKRRNKRWRHKCPLKPIIRSFS